MSYIYYAKAVLAFPFFPRSETSASIVKMAADMSRVLVIGSTGYFGKFMVDASVRLGHPTFALLRESTLASDPQKAKLTESFKSRGVNLIYVSYPTPHLQELFNRLSAPAGGYLREGEAGGYIEAGGCRDLHAEPSHAASV